ncbi:MAG TPA: ABC transporter permease subunit [Thermoplasmata archaeon]|nr:ABC transporter permease subunit [Thermoplasmata archaeon]
MSEPQPPGRVAPSVIPVSWLRGKRPGRPSDPAAFWKRRLWIGAAALLLAGVPTVISASTTGFAAVESYLPTATVDLLYSFLRMFFAYLLSLVFALSYGYFAATSRTGERILIPILDILQSVPILGFFPVVIILFVKASGPGNPIGPNFASVFLIFTSMSWNMAFGVYESLKSLPNELREATDSFGAVGVLRLRAVLFPATVNRLVYNSVLSWTAGWYYLVAAEFISTSGSSTTLPGIGTFLLSNAAPPGDPSALIAGLALLVVLIVLLDLGAWRPLSQWAERYRYDTTPSGEDVVGSRRRAPAPLRRAADRVVQGVRSGVTRLGSPFVGFATGGLVSRPGHDRPFARSAVRYALLGLALVLGWLLLIAIVVGSFNTFRGPIDPGVLNQMSAIPLAVAASFGRVGASYFLCLAISLPLAIALYQRPAFARIGLPVVEIIASVPATALFPLFIFALLGLLHDQLTSILMVMTGMIWYLFFNILSGLRGIPPDLAEAARSYGLSRWQYYRRLALPAILPAFITGSITAFGGGWNTLIIAENLHYGTSQSLSVLGIGNLIDVGNSETCGVLAQPCGFPLMAAAVLTLVVTVVAVNELLWKPLYRRAVERYRID